MLNVTGSPHVPSLRSWVPQGLPYPEQGGTIQSVVSSPGEELCQQLHVWGEPPYAEESLFQDWGTLLTAVGNGLLPHDDQVSSALSRGPRRRQNC